MVAGDVTTASRQLKAMTGELTRELDAFEAELIAA
jgi:hypothetical protein